MTFPSIQLTEISALITSRVNDKSLADYHDSVYGGGDPTTAELPTFGKESLLSLSRNTVQISVPTIPKFLTKLDIPGKTSVYAVAGCLPAASVLVFHERKANTASDARSFICTKSFVLSLSRRKDKICSKQNLVPRSRVRYNI